MNVFTLLWLQMASYQQGTRRHHAFGDHQSCLKPFTEDDFEFNDSEGDPGRTSLPSMQCNDSNSFVAIFLNTLCHWNCNCSSIISNVTEWGQSLLTSVAVSVSRVPWGPTGSVEQMVKVHTRWKLESEETAVCCTALETIPLCSTLQKRILCSGMLMLTF